MPKSYLVVRCWFSFRHWNLRKSTDILSILILKGVLRDFCDILADCVSHQLRIAKTSIVYSLNELIMMDKRKALPSAVIKDVSWLLHNICRPFLNSVGDQQLPLDIVFAVMRNIENLLTHPDKEVGSTLRKCISVLDVL